MFWVVLFNPLLVSLNPILILILSHFVGRRPKTISWVKPFTQLCCVKTTIGLDKRHFIKVIDNNIHILDRENRWFKTRVNKSMDKRRGQQ